MLTVVTDVASLLCIYFLRCKKHSLERIGAVTMHKHAIVDNAFVSFFNVLANEFLQTLYSLSYILVLVTFQRFLWRQWVLLKTSSSLESRKFGSEVAEMFSSFLLTPWTQNNTTTYLFVVPSNKENVPATTIIVLIHCRHQSLKLILVVLFWGKKWQEGVFDCLRQKTFKIVVLFWITIMYKP